MNAAELLTNIATHYNAFLRTSAHKQALTRSQALLLLNVPYDGITMSELAFRLGIDNSTLTRNVDKLILLDLVTKKRANNDKRIIKILITDNGKFVLNKIEVFLNNFNLHLIDKLDIDNQNKIIELLEKIAWSMHCLR
tara:strand:- start:354 stop:767 length:414 start_codon:yes stop_codon:yes gene_type:complete